MLSETAAACNSEPSLLDAGVSPSAVGAKRWCFAALCGRFPNSPARARQLYWGWSTFAPRPDCGVLALSFVTALIARPWKVGVRVRITCGNVPGAPAEKSRFKIPPVAPVGPALA